MEKELFIEYEEIKSKYKREKNKYDNLLEKKAMLIIQTQPKAMDFSKEPTTGGKVTNKFDDFVQRLEKLDPELQTARNERDLQEYFLKKKELELKNSKNELDIVYVYAYLKRMKARKFCYLISLSKSQVYRDIQEIEKKLKK